MDDRLIGRGPELEQLRAWLTEVGSGRGSVLFLTGEAGVGKTTLARAALGNSGWNTVEGFGLQDGASPYGPVITVLRQLLRGRAAQLEQPMRSYLAVLLPELGASPEGGDRAALFEAIRSALALGASGGPVVVFLDDLQWADEATLELLPALARSLDHEPVAILGAYRSDDIPRGHPVRRARIELRRAGRFKEVAVQALDASATAELLARTLGDTPSPSLSIAAFDRTDGVPFFVEELGLGLANSGRLQAGPSGLELVEDEDMPVPDSVRDAVLLQAVDVSQEGRLALMVASVAGQVFDPELVTAIAGLEEWPGELIHRGLMVEAKPDGMAFRHALIREAFYSELPWTQRVGLHRSVAERLEAMAAPPVIVAEHWAKGREPDRARRAFVEATGAFGAVHAYRDGMRAARRALELWPEATERIGRLEILEQLAGYAELAGDLGEAIATWREAAERREEDGAPLRLAAVRRRLAAALELQGRWEEALAWRERAAAAFDSADAPAQAAEERLASAAHLRSAARFRAALGLLEHALRDARLADRIDLEVRIIGLEGNVRARMGEGMPAVDLVRTALTVALDRDLSGPAAEIYQRLADSLEHAGDYPSARDTYDVAFNFCATNRLDQTAQLCLACLTVVLRQTGDWDRAASLCRQVIAASGSTVHARAVATGTLGSILGVRGQTKRARPLLLESASLARRIELAAMELLATWGLALIDDVEGEAESGAERCRTILDRWAETEERHYAISPLRWATTFLAGSGDTAGARACVTALGRIASDSPQPEAMSALSHGIGETALMDGDHDLAATQFAQALELLRGAEAPFERIESERRAAAALTKAGRSDEAVERLVAAYRIARRLRARPVTERIAASLSEFGERAERRLSRRAIGEIAGGGLTRRETEVVRLVAVGRTSREIARELFVSPRTVEMHVQNILAKLDCRSRADAARRASELGLLRGSNPMPSASP